MSTNFYSCILVGYNKNDIEIPKSWEDILEEDDRISDIEKSQGLENWDLGIPRCSISFDRYFGWYIQTESYSDKEFEINELLYSIELAKIYLEEMFNKKPKVMLLSLMV